MRKAQGGNVESQAPAEMPSTRPSTPSVRAWVALRKVNKGEQGDDIEAEETAGMGLDNPTAAEQDWVELTPHGATDLTTVEITDTIAAINRNKRIITFAGNGGKARTIRVGPNVSLDQVEAGDEVVLEVTRAVAVDSK